MNRLIYKTNSLIKLNSSNICLRYVSNGRIKNINSLNEFNNSNNINNNNNINNSYNLNSSYNNRINKNNNINKINKSNNIKSNNSNNSIKLKNFGEHSEIFLELKDYLSNDSIEVKRCISLFEKLPYKTESLDAFFVHFKLIVYKGIQQKSALELFIFVRDNIHYFPLFINADIFIKLLEMFYEFQVSHKDALVIEYYNYPFDNMLQELFEYYIVDFKTVEVILAFLIGNNDLKLFDKVFKMYIEKSDIIKVIAKELEYESSSSNSSLPTSNSSLPTSNSSQLIKQSNNEYQYNNIQPLNVDSLDLINLPPILILRLVHRAVLNKEISNTITLLNSLIEKNTLALDAFQIVLEVCHYKDFKDLELIILQYFTRKECYKLYSLLIYFNQVTGKSEMFYKLLGYLDDQSIFSNSAKSEILSLLIPINLFFKNEDLAFLWLQTFATNYNINVEPSLYSYVYYESSVFHGNTFYLSIWTDRLEDFCGLEEPTQEKLEESLKVAKNNFEQFIKYRGFNVFLQNNLNKTNDKLFGSLKDKVQNPHQDNNKIEHNTILPFGSVTKITKSDSTPWETSSLEEIADYIITNYFEKGYLPPVRSLFKTIYQTRKDYSVHKKFSLKVPANVYPFLFDRAFFLEFLNDDFDEAINYLSKQHDSIIKSKNTRSKIITVLLENKMFDLATKILLTMVKENLSITPLSKLIVHCGRFHRYNIPKQILDKLVELKGLKIDTYILLQHINNNRIKEAYDHFISREEGIHHVDSIRLVLKHVFPHLYPLSDNNNIAIWTGLLENSQQHLLNKNIQFYDSFFCELNRCNRDDLILEAVLKDREILRTVNQKTLAIVLGSINNNPQLVLELFKKAREYDSYHSDLKKILLNNNSQINNGSGDPSLNQFLEKAPFKNPTKEKPSLILSDKTLEFIDKHYIDKSIVLTEPTTIILD